jgi:hypothetical protein
VARLRDEREEGNLRKAATDFWFAVKRMARHGEGPPPLLDPPPGDAGDDHLNPSGVPRRPTSGAGSASAAVPEPDEDDAS